MKRRYIPITQQPFCCVPACMQMVMLRRGIPLMSQEEIGYSLGLVVPKSYRHIFPKAMTGKRPRAGYGTQVDKPQFSINNFFRRKGIPLKEEYYPVVGEISDESVNRYGRWLKELIGEGKDIIAVFDYGKLYGGRRYGHASLVEDVVDGDVILVDPGQDVPKFRKVRMMKLLQAMKNHGVANRGGFWVISSKQATE